MHIAGYIFFINSTFKQTIDLIARLTRLTQLNYQPEDL
jgi:hypothetical protein